jgi:hypothetical protein
MMSTGVYTGLNPFSFIRKTVSADLQLYRTSTAVYQLNSVTQQHTATATSIVTTKSPGRRLSAQRLSERTVFVSKLTLRYLLITIDTSNLPNATTKFHLAATNYTNLQDVTGAR